MSQVKNLRAMFENKGDTSPPDRGRSGASTPISTIGSVTVESPRPLSKVRTAFVAVEKDGRIGLKRNPSSESDQSRRSISMDTDTGSTSTAADKQSVLALDETSRTSKSVRDEPIPESPVQPSTPEQQTPRVVKTPSPKIETVNAAVTDEPSVNPDKQTDQETPSPTLLPAEAPAETTEEPAQKLAEELAEKPAGEPAVEKTKEKKQPQKADSPKKTTRTPAVNGKAKAEKPKESTTSAKTTTTVKKATLRPSAISTKPSATTKPAAKSPAAKSPTAKSPTAKSPTNAAPKREPRAATKTSDKLAPKPAPARAPSRQSATAAKKPATLKPAFGEASSAKPKPRSPTRPVNLPSSLTAPTAAFAHKGGRADTTATKQTGGVPKSSSTRSLSVPRRSASRASTNGPVADKATKAQKTTVSRSRPSIGPPPKKQAQDNASAKKDAPVDESFLARMMRPTQASAQKTHEKVPGSPPRKASKRPSTAGTDVSKSSSTRATSVKPSSKRSDSTTPSDSASQSGAKFIEAVEPETADLPTETQAASEEVAPETATVDAAEVVVELAKEADLVQAPVSTEMPAVKIEEPAAPEDAATEKLDELAISAEDDKTTY